MKHPVRALLLAALLAAGLTGCVKQEAAHTPTPTPQADTSVSTETHALPPVAATTPAAAAPTPTPTPTPQPTEAPEPTPEPGFQADPDAPVVLVTYGTEDGLSAQVLPPLQSFCETTGKSSTTLLVTSGPSDEDPAGTTLAQALSGECGLLVAQGAGFGRAVEAQAPGKPNVAFLLLDAGVENPAPNTVCALFDQVQMGYLAGYTAVSEGYTKLGYLTNLEDAAAQEYGCGYLQGIQDAAEAMDVTVSLLYYPLGPNSSPDEVGELAQLLYRSGIQVLFAPGEGLSQTLEDAATAAGGIGAILTERAPEGAGHVVSTVEKDPSQVLPRLLASAYDGTFPGGKVLSLGCGEKAITMDISRLKRMSRYDYEHIYGKLTTGAAVPLTPAQSGGVDGLSHDRVTVTFLNRRAAEPTETPEPSEIPASP